MLKMTHGAAGAAEPPIKSMALAGDEWDGGEEDFKPLTHEEAEKLCAANPSLSPWAIVAGQWGVGVVVALAAWGLTGRPSAGWSAAYGALAVALPAAIFARGLTGRFSSLNQDAAVFRFFLWEMVKIALTVAMLVAAPRLVAALSWPALLVGLLVTMKVYWVAMVVRPKKLKQTDE